MNFKIVLETGSHSFIILIDGGKPKDALLLKPYNPLVKKFLLKILCLLTDKQSFLPFKKNNY